MKPTRRGIFGIVAGLFAGGTAKTVAAPVQPYDADGTLPADNNVFTAPHDGYYVFSSRVKLNGKTIGEPHE